MRVIRVAQAGRKPNRGDIFVGEVLSQMIVGDEVSQLRLNEVTFLHGARNRLHVHSTDQILVVTAGEGIVADEREKHEISAGDVAFIPVGERHWHGAQPGHDMTHWSITGRAETEIVDGA